MDKPKIFDQQGQEQDWNWLTANFGAIELERAEVSAGVTQIYRIVKLQDSEGPAVQVVNVADRDGIPLDGIRVVRHWPDAPQLPSWLPPISLWRNKGVYGPTNINGDIGFGMGHGDYYFAPSSGASSVWVADEAGPADFIKGLGMLGGTNHRHLDVLYQLVAVETKPPEPPEKPPEEPPEKPPEEAPEQPPQDRWQALMDKLDLIITLLEGRVD
jgi:hypothetical protein